jgi:hypothetical protein
MQTLPFQNLKLAINKSHNPEYYNDLLGAILRYLAHHQIPYDEDYLDFQLYVDEPGLIIYNRPFTHFPVDSPLNEDPAGFTLHLRILVGTMTPELNSLLLELRHRVTWGILDIETEYFLDPMPFNTRIEPQEYLTNCWHHTSITYNRAFCQKPLYFVQLQAGYCYCS